MRQWEGGVSSRETALYSGCRRGILLSTGVGDEFLSGRGRDALLLDNLFRRAVHAVVFRTQHPGGGKVLRSAAGRAVFGIDIIGETLYSGPQDRHSEYGDADFDADSFVETAGSAGETPLRGPECTGDHGAGIFFTGVQYRLCGASGGMSPGDVVPGIQKEVPFNAAELSYRMPVAAGGRAAGKPPVFGQGNFRDVRIFLSGIFCFGLCLPFRAFSVPVFYCVPGKVSFSGDCSCSLRQLGADCSCLAAIAVRRRGQRCARQIKVSWH